MISIGIDPGSNRTGYGMIRADGPRLTFLAAGVIAAGTGPLCQRLVEIGRELEDVCDEAMAKLRPDETIVAGIEAGYSDGHGATALVLGAARGVALYVVRCHLNREVREYQPATVKKAACGSGKATKDQVARVVARRLGMKREPAADAADALAVAIARACDGSINRRETQ